MKRKLLSFLGAILCTSVVMTATTHNVSVSSNVFTPSSLTIQLGDTVVWTNTGGNHNVNGSTTTYPNNPASFNSGAASTAAWTFQHVFTVAGAYDYQCDPHLGLGMTGTITVNAAATNGIAFQSFEKATPGTWTFTATPAAYNTEGLGDDTIGGNEDVWDSIAVFSGDISSAAEGGMFWGMQDLDNGNGGGSFNHTLDFAPVSMAGLSNAFVSFDYYTIGYDSSDSLSYAVEFDNGSTWGTPVLLNKDTQAWTNVNIPVPASATHVRLRIQATQNGSSDFAAVDNFLVDTAAAQSGTPTYTIAQVTSSDPVTGNADSLNTQCILTGVVYSIDFDGNNGYSFYMQDATGGINVFSFNDVSSYSNPSIGDSIWVEGEIGQFRGLIQMEPDSIVLLGTGATVTGPAVVTTLDETTEGEFVEFRGARLIDATQWPASGSGNVDITNGLDTITLRIDSDTDIDGTPAPVNVVFNVRGAGGQFDFSSPFLEGYQLFPRSWDDIDTVPASSFPLYDIADVTTNDANLVPDSINVECEIRGVVHSTDFDGNNGVNFYLYDQTGGIAVFNFSDPDFYNDVRRGDSLHIFGDIGQFRGLTQIFADSVVLFGRGVALQTPAIVSTLDETTEGEFIEMQGFSVINPGQWPSAGSSASVDITNGTDTVVLRIDSDTDIDGTPVPTTAFDVIGSGGQFTFSSPANDGYQILPSSINDFTFAAPTAPTVNFALSSQTVQENVGTVDVNLLVSPVSSTQDTVSLAFTLGSNLTTGDGTISPSPNIMTGLLDIVVPANEDSINFQFSVIDDAILEGNETLFVAVTGVSANLDIGLNNSFEFIIEDNDFVIPTYDIIDVKGLDADGVPDSLGVMCKLVGTIFTDDFDGNNGYSAYMYDNTGAMNVFNFTDVSGYQVQRGDSIRAIGEIDFFRGLTEIKVDSIVVLASNVPLRQPRQVFDLDESTESDYVRLNGFYLADPSQWPMFSGPSFNVDITNGQDTLEMRIDSDTDINGVPAPTGYFDVIGAGGQFDPSVPHDEGYQIFPRDTNDIIPVSLPELHVSEVMPSSGLSAPVDGDWFEIRNTGSVNVDLQGFSWDDESRDAGNHTITTSIVLPAGESAIFLESATGDVAAWETEWKQTGNGLIILNEANQFDNGFSGLSSNGDEVNFYDAGLRLVSSAAYTDADVTAGFSIEFDADGNLLGAAVDGVNGAYTSVNGDVGSPGDLSPISVEEFFTDDFTLYPNPAQDQIFIQTSTNAPKHIRVLNSNGKVLMDITRSESLVNLNVSGLATGFYFISLELDGQTATRKLVVQ